MAIKSVYLTAEGCKKLKEELDYLCRVRRPQVAENIKEAKEGGDIMENAGYDEAKNEQAFVEGRIATLEAMLKNAVIIEKPGPIQAVALGSWVTVAEGSGEEERYQIVGWAEADPQEGRISNESPLGKALLGRGVGDEIAIEAPDGVRHFRILSIE